MASRSIQIIRNLVFLGFVLCLLLMLFTFYCDIASKIGKRMFLILHNNLLLTLNAALRSRQVLSTSINCYVQANKFRTDKLWLHLLQWFYTNQMSVLQSRYLPRLSFHQVCGGMFAFLGHHSSSTCSHHYRLFFYYTDQLGSMLGLITEAQLVIALLDSEFCIEYFNLFIQTTTNTSLLSCIFNAVINEGICKKFRLFSSVGNDKCYGLRIVCHVWDNYCTYSPVYFSGDCG